MTGRSLVAFATLLLCPGALPAQVSIRGAPLLGHMEHRVGADELIAASGTVFGGSVLVAVGPRVEIDGDVLGGTLAATSSLDDHDFAQADLLGGWRAHPWLWVQTGVSVWNFSNPLARQHWTTWRIGAEARLPLGFEGVSGMVRGYWLPVVHISGLSAPRVALAAAVGLAWRGRHFGADARYTFERYDFAATSSTQRLEELSTLRVSVGVWWSRHGALARP